MDQLKFYNQYRQYSTADLLNIVREKDNYQAAAVLAAEQLLAEREVSSFDEEEADRYFQEKETKRMASTARVGAVKAVVADWMEPIARPSVELQPDKWYRIFVVVYGIYYLRDLYFAVRYFTTAYSIGWNLEDFVVVGGTLALDTFLFVLVIRRRKWGWILLVVEHTVLIFINVSLFVEMSRLRMFHVNSMPNLYGALFHLAMVGFLLRRTMAEFFGVGPVVKKWALGVGLGLGVVFALLALYTIWQNGSPAPLMGKPSPIQRPIDTIVPARP
jgi:hypothetical protein